MTEQLWQTKEDLTNLLVQLVEHRSVTGSEAEIAISEYIHLRLRELPYFKENPHMLELHPTKDGRKLVTALVKNKNTKKTIILVNHFDVVDVEDYGEWKNLAFRPRELTDAFKRQKEHIPEEVNSDLENGDWLFGRGTMDMKAGLALQMGLIEQACSGEFDGNIMLLSVPDEEANSLGMTTAADMLLELAYKYDLKYTACLNAEPMFTRYPGDENNYIYSGSIGKALPGFFCYGKETHVGEPFAGVNANFMVSKLTELMELNTDFCEMVDGEVTPPPTNLMQKDLKENYSVQIPNTAVTLYNVLLMEQPLERLNEQLFQVAEEAAQRIEDHYYKQSQKFSQWLSFDPDEINVRVMTYEELRNEAITQYGKPEIDRRQMYTMANYQELGDRDLSTRLVFDLASLCKHLAPMVVLFYSPPYYPAVSSRNCDIIQKTIDQVKASAADQYDITFNHQRFFPGLSDLSYTSLQQSQPSLYSLIGNMPLYGKGYDLPVDELKALDIPVMNLGPLGRDPHQWTERVNLDYTFGPLTDLLRQAIKELLK